MQLCTTFFLLCTTTPSRKSFSFAIRSNFPSVPTSLYYFKSIVSQKKGKLHSQRGSWITIWNRSVIIKRILLAWLSDVFSIPWSSVSAHELTGQSLLDTTDRHVASPQSHRRTVPSLEHAVIMKQSKTPNYYIFDITFSQFVFFIVIVFLSMLCSTWHSLCTGT